MTAPKVRWEVRWLGQTRHVGFETVGDARRYRRGKRGQGFIEAHVVKVTTRPAGAYAALAGLVAKLPLCLHEGCMTPATGQVYGCMVTRYCDAHRPTGGWRDYSEAPEIRAAVAALAGGAK